MDVIPKHHRLRILAEQMYAASRIATWVLGSEGEMLGSTHSEPDTFYQFFQLSGCLDYMLSFEGGLKVPCVMSDRIGMVWTAETMYVDDRLEFTVLMGPVFYSESSLKQIESDLAGLQSSVQLRTKMFRMLDKIPVVTTSAMNHFAVMMHYALTEKTIDASEFIYQPTEVTEERKAEYPFRERTAYDRVALAEKQILQTVRDGNLDYMKVLHEVGDVGEDRLSSSGNSLRDAKNTAIVFCALCCRAAIDGGLPGPIAKEMESEYMNSFEQARTITELTRRNTRMMKDYVTRVHELKENGQISREVRESCAYIRNNLTNDLTAATIAAHVGYSEYYFTKKFSREMGIRVTDYIRDAKIDYAKMLLTTTEKSIQDISDQLNFSTRNYFSKVFQTVTGVSPVVYRKLGGKLAMDDLDHDRKDEADD